MSNQSGDWLVFVDTNIFLDFYRQSGPSVDRLLAALEKHTDRLITGDQVRMEFYKNRQKVIQKSLSDLKEPAAQNLPQILSNLKPSSALSTQQKLYKEKFKEVKARGELILTNPARYDKVFQSFKRIYGADTKYNLCRPMKERFSVRSLARKRFALGYPPRKAGDTSIGDSLNWEWIIHCAKQGPSKKNVLIVSRDGDYGISINNDAVLNDWLQQEFKDRVSNRVKIRLTTKLTDALRILDEEVMPEDIEEENRIIETGKRDENDSEGGEIYNSLLLLLRDSMSHSVKKNIASSLSDGEDTGDISPEGHDKG